MGIRVIHVMTHDEDDPTHQPVELPASLRAIPNLLVFRPGDAVETAEAGDCALRAMPVRCACRGRRCRRFALAATPIGLRSGPMWWSSPRADATSP